jgi:hypothetical protein
MFDVIGIADNYTIVPAPVLDESQPKGYRIEQRMQVTLKAASNERDYTVEFRLGENSQAPSEELLNRWIESGDMVQAFCIGLTARPFVHQEGKTYQARGSQKEINGSLTTLDTFVVFAGYAMAPLMGGQPGVLEEMVKQARGAYKRSQRQYRAQRNAERAKQQEVQLEERARQLLERKAKQEADKADQVGAASAAATEAETAASANGRKR